MKKTWVLAGLAAFVGWRMYAQRRQAEQAAAVAAATAAAAQMSGFGESTRGGSEGAEIDMAALKPSSIPAFEAAVAGQPGYALPNFGLLDRITRAEVVSGVPGGSSDDTAPASFNPNFDAGLMPTPPVKLTPGQAKAALSGLGAGLWDWY